MKTLPCICLFAAAALAQKTFDLKGASRFFDVKVKVAKCDGGFCDGKATFSFYKKGAAAPYQVINVPDTQIWLDKLGNAQVNYTLLYDEQSVLNVGDFNFDGQEDVAICDGHNGSYGMPSYRVYLSSHGKFVYSAPFSKLGQVNLGMFSVDKKRRTLETFNKSGCCEHFRQTFKIVQGRPKLIEDVAEYYDPPSDQGFIVTETKRLVNGKWRKTRSREKVPPQ